MSTPIIINPRPNARIVTIGELNSTIETYEIRDGDEIIMKCSKKSHALAMLPLIQSGE